MIIPSKILLAFTCFVALIALNMAEPEPEPEPNPGYGSSLCVQNYRQCRQLACGPIQSVQGTVHLCEDLCLDKYPCGRPGVRPPKRNDGGRHDRHWWNGKHVDPEWILS